MVQAMVRVRVRLVPDGVVREVEVPEGARARDVLRALGLEEGSHVVMVSGRPVPEDEVVSGAGEVVVVRVLSGG